MVRCSPVGLPRWTWQRCRTRGCGSRSPIDALRAGSSTSIFWMKSEEAKAKESEQRVIAEESLSRANRRLGLIERQKDDV